MNKEQYEKARREFEELRIEDKAVFLVEAAAATLARGVERFGSAVVDEMDRAFRKKEAQQSEKEPPADTSNGNGSVPETPPM